MSKASRQCSGPEREQARQALTRGRRSEPSVVKKLSEWQCEDQGELWSRQDLRTDQRPESRQ